MKFEIKEEKSKTVEISESDFKDYWNVQKSGITNMFDVKTVEMYSGLSRDKQRVIRQNYEQLEKAFPTVKK